MKIVTSVDDLKTLAYRENGDFVEFYLMLAGGLARSCKRISYRRNEKCWLVINEIDDSYQELNEDELDSETLIVKAINNKAFVLSDMP